MVAKWHHKVGYWKQLCLISLTTSIGGVFLYGSSSKVAETWDNVWNPGRLDGCRALGTSKRAEVSSAPWNDFPQELCFGKTMKKISPQQTWKLWVEFFSSQSSSLPPPIKQVDWEGGWLFNQLLRLGAGVGGNKLVISVALIAKFSLNLVLSRALQGGRVCCWLTVLRSCFLQLWMWVS